MKKQTDNLFDGDFTFLDAVKILLLIVTAFSTWNVVGVMTPDAPFAMVRMIAAMGMVEGAFLGFEYATKNAKNARQVRWSTLGFFCSLAVIGIFAATSGLLEFGGSAMLDQLTGSEWLSIHWTVGEIVKVGALATFVIWIVGLASIYRMYSLNDPDKQAELQRSLLMGEVTTEANTALKDALEKAKPVIARKRALASVKETYGSELSADEMTALQTEMEKHLRDVQDKKRGKKETEIAVDPAVGFVQKEAVISPLSETGDGQGGVAQK